MLETGRKALQSILVAVPLAMAQTSISEMPANLRESIEWVWNNRIVPRSASAPIGEGSTVRQNLIFDQIYDNNGSLNYVIRWQSAAKLTLAQRKGLETMIQRQIGNWTKHLAGFEGWPFKDVTVKVVAVAVDKAEHVVDPQPGEVIYTAYSADPVNKDDPKIPVNLPYAPATCSRFEHFTESSYSYAPCPQGSKGRFDMYLWATSNWNGGVGGDWGQRMADTYYLNNLNTEHVTMVEHEIGHGFGITDFYGAAERPPKGFPTKLVMWAGNSPSITEWDAWMLRYIWSKLKADKVRFPPKPTGIVAHAEQGAPRSIRGGQGTLEIFGKFDRADVFDLRGNLVLGIPANQSRTDIASLPKGVLKIRISKDGSTTTGSILHQ